VTGFFEHGSTLLQIQTPDEFAVDDEAVTGTGARAGLDSDFDKKCLDRAPFESERQLAAR